MTERLIQTPELWSGHSFDDECLWEEEDVNLVDKATEFLSPLLKYRMERLVFNKLQEFLRNLPDALIKRFQQGEIFEMGKFPKGTIVKFSYDYEKGGDSEHFEEEWGIITQEKETGDLSSLIVSFSIEDFLQRFQFDNASRIYEEQIPIGEAIHTKTKSKFGKWQDLTRFNFVEIWKLGKKVSN